MKSKTHSSASGDDKTLVDNLNAPLGYAPGMPADIPAPQSMGESPQAKQTRERLEKFRDALLKAFPFTRALGILPAFAAPLLEEDEGIAKEVADTKPMHVIMLIPEDEYKNLGKIKPEVIRLAKESGENMWIHIKTTEVDIWNYGLDSKFEFVDAVGMSYPLHDTGFLGALRVAVLHKNLVLNWLNTGRVKYVATYAIGGSLVRGTADATSDVDTFVIIDDTDVKRMSRIELLEKLRGKIVYDFIREANAMAGVKNILNVQVYLLTDFWQSVKDAQPIMFTFIRDGVPLYDRGTFIPWKRLLQMGKIRPSPEAIDLYMKEGDRTEEIVKRRMMDAMVDIYFGVVTPTQAMMMLAEHAPPVPKTIVHEVKEALVTKEKVMSLSDLKTLEKAVKLYKDYEHGKLKEISGKEIDALLQESKAYAKRMKELRTKLETRVQQHQVEKICTETSTLLQNVLHEKNEKVLLTRFEKDFVKKGKLPDRMGAIAKEILLLRKTSAKKPLSVNDMQRVIRDAADLSATLTEYLQRRDLSVAEKGLFQIKAGEQVVEIALTQQGVFVVDRAHGIRRIEKDSFAKASQKDLDAALSVTQELKREPLSSRVLQLLEKEYGQFSFVL